jgi:hypothetical protein
MTVPSDPPARTAEVLPRTNRAGLLAQSSGDVRAWKVVEQDLGADMIEEALAFDVSVRTAGGSESAKDEAALSPAASMLSRLRDPSYARKSIREIARECGILLPELLEMVRSRDVAIGFALSGRHTSAVLEGIAKMAMEGEAVCTVCFGECQVPLLDKKGKPVFEDADEGEEPIQVLKSCPCCKGKGSVSVPPNLDAAKFFVKVQGLDKSSGGGNTNINLAVQQGMKIGGGKTETDQEHITVRVERAISGGGD